MWAVELSLVILKNKIHKIRIRAFKQHVTTMNILVQPFLKNKIYVCTFIEKVTAD